MTVDLKGKTALVTGASRGIGAATAITLANNGVSKLIIHYGGYKQGADETAEAARKAGAEVEVIGADLGTDKGISEFVAAMAGRKVDILVNNAGSLVKRAKLPEYTPELWDTVMNLNVKSVYFITQALAPHMVEQKSGHVILLSSIAARNGGGPGATVYAAAKAAIAAMTKGLAKELAPAGVRVNAVSPGTVDNHFHETFSNKQILDGVVAMTPAGRLGTNEEIADTVLFLISDAARYMYGQTLEINGGMLMV